MFEATATEATAFDGAASEGAEADEVTGEAVQTTFGWSIPALLVGVVLTATAISGLLNEVPATEHPLWIVPAIGAFAVCFAVVGRTVRALSDQR